MDEKTITIKEIDVMPQQDPYHKSELCAMWTKLWFDPRSNEAGISQEYDDNAQPADEWAGLVLANSIQRPDEHAARWYLEGEDGQKLLTEIRDGYEADWSERQGCMMGRLTDAAQSAWERLLAEINELPECEWSLGDVNERIADESDPSAMTRAEMESLADEIEMAAADDREILNRPAWIELFNRWASGRDYLSTADAAHWMGVETSHLRRMIGAGKIKATKMGRDWMIRPWDLEDAGRTRAPKKARAE